MALDYLDLLSVALEEARQGLAEGGIPIGAALFNGHGEVLGRGQSLPARFIQNHPEIWNEDIGE